MSVARLLVIDDDLDFVELLAELFELRGCTVAVATDMEAGIALALEVQPDVVFCDLNIGHWMSGLAVARELRARPATASARLVALTGMPMERVEAPARAAGFDLVMEKPVEIARLDEIVGPSCELLAGGATG